MPSASAEPPPGPRVTLRDVARALGVSVATVSNAYNRPDQLSAELRERILQQAQALGYHGPDPLARSLRRGRTGVLGVVYDAPLDYAFADPAAALFLGSVARAVQGEGLSALLLASPHGPDADVTLPVRSASVDGFIVYCAAGGSALLRAVLDRRLPTVLVDQDPQPGVVGVGIDDLGGAQAAAAHLLALGHRQLGAVCLPLTPGGLLDSGGGPLAPDFVPPTGYRPSVQRLAGYRAALSGVPGAALHLTETVQNTPEEGEARALALLQAQPGLSALLCMSDVLAQGALRAAAALGRQVPGDLSVIGYDDLPSSAALNLTTVWQPTAEKGRAVGEAMRALLRGEAAHELCLPTRLTLRGTAAPPPALP
ncbi:LacI family DNA-binding transcriptional regulator [Deinococcus multiflagellatus]|uniref:LacI family DNA-binding transcriptional regulator n=1 Tax=Deinococcus multiflagellatus TaxID=1656887 RepID=UPI001CCA183F|nr:LacI family DNA-binding transcriptional regulator [Deinococcus multiflagellatus]MBZ9716094.1 LacI family DNA-binding transcriptional regulator [Deinococcus multiflagellatus]